MKEFKTYHPIVNMVYFVFVIGFSCFFTHPICLAISFICAFTYSAMLNGSRKTKMSLIYTLPILTITALTNPAFNHEGATILAYLPSGNPFTLESLLYGIGAAVLLISVIYWFSCYNAIMTSDKFVYLFGKIIPSLSLVMSMTLRFVPRFSAQLKVVSNAQKCIGRSTADGGIVKKAKFGLMILSVMITWALENAIETAGSMKARGYGLPGRTAFSIFTFDKRDKTALIYIMFFGIYTLIGSIFGGIYFRYFPSLKSAEFTLFSASVFISYLALCVYPIMIETREVLRWKAIESKI